MALYSTEEVFIKTVNCKLAQEDGSSFPVSVGRKAEGDTALVPEINMDLGFKYGVQLPQHSYSFVILAPVYI